MPPVWHPSPNAGRRRNGAQPELIVLHFTAMESAEAACERLCDRAAEVSAHYLIAADGRLWQLVAEEDRAWHAGAGSWGGAADVNSRSIGVELDNDGHAPFAAPLMSVLEPLLARLMADWAIPPERVIGHSDMAPERKDDPGRRFDWRRLARQDLAVWPQPDAAPEPPDPAGFLAAARRFGYPDAGIDLVLEAVRQRFRPWAAGPLSAADMAVVGDLARRFPVDGAAATA